MNCINMNALNVTQWNYKTDEDNMCSCYFTDKSGDILYFNNCQQIP